MNLRGSEQSVKQLSLIGAIMVSDGSPPALRPHRRGRDRQLLRRRSGHAHRPVERVHPHRPARAGARRDPRRPDDRRAHPEGQVVVRRARHIQVELEPSSPTSPPCTTRSPVSSASGASARSGDGSCPWCSSASPRRTRRSGCRSSTPPRRRWSRSSPADKLDLAVVNLPVERSRPHHRAALRRGPHRHRPAGPPPGRSANGPLHRPGRPRPAPRAQGHVVPRRAATRRPPPSG